jgi:hypothetical protein
LTWVISYVYLAFYYDRWNLLKVRIHESGRYTLLGTIFYFNHFLRELLLDTFMALCMFWTYRVTHSKTFMGESEGYFTLILLVLILFLAMIFVGSVRSVGLRNSLLDLFQFRELDTVIEFGSHWQMHFLSTLTLMLLIILPGTLYGWEDLTQIVILFLSFFAISLLFRTGKKAIGDRRWVMHGGREILTFFLLVILPSYGLNLQAQSLSLNIESMAVLILVAGILLYSFLIYLRSDVKNVAQGDFGIAYLISSHFFEHVLDYAYIFLLFGVLLYL